MRSRRPWSLQTRLMATIIGVVAAILVIVAVTTSTVLGIALQANVGTRLDTATRSLSLIQPGLPPTVRSAAQALAASRQPPGFLLLVRAPSGAVSAAVVGDDFVIAGLTPAQREALLDAAVAGRSTTTLPRLGSYRIATLSVSDAGISGISGLPLAEANATITQMLLTIGLVTAAGLVLLAIAVAVVIRVGLRPLRAVAETATRVAALPMAEGAVTIGERVPAAEADDRTEIGRVGAALNTLLDHIDVSLTARQRNEERMRRFVADASHELRTPLASIRGYSELSLRDPALSDDTEQSLERIQAQSLRMTKLVEDLLLLARLDEGQELVYGAVDLTQLVVEAVGDARPAGLDHRWTLDVGDDPIVIAGDASRLHQVLANLLANARVHTPAGTTVAVSLVREGTDAVVRVHDDGPGVDPAVADGVFERFARADRSRARATGGTGLGLSIAKAIVDAHGGALTVTSAPGDTTFAIRLPARPEDPPHPDAHTS